MLTTLTHTRFLRTQIAFEQTVNKSPTVATVVIKTATTRGSFTDFTGDSTRSEVLHEVKCLYRRNFTSQYRTKYGLRNNISGIIWVPVKYLLEKIGRFDLSPKELAVELHGFRYIVDQVVLNSPHYNSCIAVEMRLAEEDQT